MKIAINKGNTRACIKATNSSCKYRTTGPNTGKSNQTRFVLKAHNQAINIASKIHQEVTFQNNLKESDIIFAK